ncbi:MAG TPA: glycosyltransferase [Gemmatimonadaceae bacterium]|nr:glycosyltransferase [Gemmatimonadaceae bacterium]
MGISVVVCTRGRPAQLRRALRSLVEQTPPPAELLVVDNGVQEPETRLLVCTEFPGVRYIPEPVEGLDFARNRGLRSAREEIVAFIDDDAVAAPGWVARIASVFDEHPAIAICTGRVEALDPTTEGARLFESNGGFSRGLHRIHLPRDMARSAGRRRMPLIAWSISVGSGCSLAVRRRAALELGGFDEALDLGAALPGGGDLDMLWRALDAGMEVVYEPAVFAWHEHRSEAATVVRQILEHNRALVAVLTKSARQARGRRRLEVLAFLAWRLTKPGVRLARRLGGRDPLPGRALLRLWWYCWRGVGAYPAARRLAQRRLGTAR